MSPVPAGCWPFPTLSLPVFPWMLGPIPRRLPRCLCPFLPRGLRPSPRFDGVGSPQFTRTATSVRETFFGAAGIPLCSGLQVCSPPRSLRPIPPSSYGRRGFYFRASYSSLPLHTSDMLTARIGQLAVGDSHPIRLAERYWRKMLSSRSQRGNIVWETFHKIRKSFPLRHPRLYVPFAKMQTLAVL